MKWVAMEGGLTPLAVNWRASVCERRSFCECSTCVA